jgi:tripartite-type tricarboxylate transporter receptor subunit TctC
MLDQTLTGGFARFALALAAFAFTGAAAAQDYPTKPIRIVVGFPPGGGVDIVARQIGAEMQKTLGQPIVIENRPGAGGSIGAEFVAKSAADGYTLLMGNTGSLTINPSLYPKLGYDTQRDFAPVGLISTSPLVVAVNPSLPAKSLGEFLALAKKRPGETNFGTGGNGSIAHLTVELLKARTNVDMTHVPYKGGTPAVTDVVAGQLQMVVEGVPLVAPFVQQKKLRALVVTSAKRSPALPDVPTVVEAGFPDLVSTAWYGIVAPAGTPPAIVARLNQSIGTALGNPGFRENLNRQGSEAAGGTPGQFGDFLKQELARWSKAVKVSGAKIE